MHLLKSMGGGAFGASKPAATSAKSSYFSSLKLEYSLINAETKSKNQKEENKRIKTRRQVLPKVLFLNGSPWISILPASVLSKRVSSRVPWPWVQQTVPPQNADQKTETIDKLKRSSRLPQEKTLPLFHSEGHRWTSGRKYLPSYVELIEKLKNGLVGQNKSAIEDVD